jgi:hypothetical protein
MFGRLCAVRFVLRAEDPRLRARNSQASRRLLPLRLAPVWGYLRENGPALRQKWAANAFRWRPALKTRQGPSVGLAYERPLGCRKLGTVILARKQVAVDVRGHGDRGVPESMLHHLERQPQAAVLAPVDAP